MADGNEFRVPPHSIEAEMCVLGSMMLDPAVIDIAVQINKPEHFFRPAHVPIFQALVDMRNDGKPIDLVLLRDELTSRGRLDKVGGVEYLVSLAEGVPNAANLEFYAQIVRDKAILREVIRAGADMTTAGYDPQAKTEEVVDEAEKRVYAIASDHTKPQAVFLKDILQETFETLQKNDGKNVTGVATGYHQLDTMTCGLQKGDLIILAARPSMGKTSFLLNVIEHMGVVEQLSVALFSLEMSNDQLAQRCLPPTLSSRSSKCGGE